MSVKVIDKKLLIKRANRAASTYDAAALFQRTAGERLLERLDYIRIDPEIIVDLGCSTGFCSQQLQTRYPDATVVSLDIAEQMLRQRDLTAPLCADVEQLPLPANSVDFLFANLLLHWCSDLPQAIAEMQRVLKPEGLLMFTTVGPDTLQELRQAFAKVDNQQRVHPFHDMHDIGDCLLQTGLHDPVMDMEYLTIHYPNSGTLLRDLRRTGTTNTLTDQPNSLAGKTKLIRLREAYEAFKTEQGYPATFEIIYGHAWGPSSQRNADGEVSVPISAIKTGSS